MKNISIILASGSGSRFGGKLPKQFHLIDGKTVLEHSILAFNNNQLIDKIIVVANPNFLIETQQIASKFNKVSKVINGGETRQQSSYNGVFAVDDTFANVLIHDAARPFVSNSIINNCINALKNYKAVNTAIEMSDTVIEVNENNIIKSVPNRKMLRRCQTPQCFDIQIIKQAHTLAKENNFNNATDDCTLVLKYNLADIIVVEGSPDNKKITYTSDIK